MKTDRVNGGEDWLSLLAMYTAMARSIDEGGYDSVDNDYGSSETGGLYPARDYLRLAAAAMDARDLPPGVTWQDHKKTCIANPPERCPYMPDVERKKVLAEKAKGDGADVLSSRRKRQKVNLNETVNLGFVEMPKFLVSDMMDREAARKGDREWQDNYDALADAVSSDLEQFGDTMAFVPDKSASFLKRNTAYEQGSVDFVDICLKRELTLRMLSDIMKEEPNLEFTGHDVQIIIDQLKKAHSEHPEDAKYIDWACAACFVEHYRQQLGHVVRKFKDCCRGKIPEETGPKQRETIAKLEAKLGKKRVREIGREMSLFDLVIPDGYSRFREKGEDYAEVYRSFVDYNNNRGTGRE